MCNVCCLWIEGELNYFYKVLEPFLSSDCGETFTSSTGSFSSPNYPDYYPSTRDCVFKITVQVNMQIMLNFSHFELEGSPPSCNFDFVEIR